MGQQHALFQSSVCRDERIKKLASPLSNDPTPTPNIPIYALSYEGNLYESFYGASTEKHRKIVEHNIKDIFSTFFGVVAVTRRNDVITIDGMPSHSAERALSMLNSTKNSESSSKSVIDIDIHTQKTGILLSDGGIIVGKYGGHHLDNQPNVKWNSNVRYIKPELTQSTQEQPAYRIYLTSRTRASEKIIITYKNSNEVLLFNVFTNRSERYFIDSNVSHIIGPSGNPMVHGENGSIYPMVFSSDGETKGVSHELQYETVALGKAVRIQNGPGCSLVTLSKSGQLKAYDCPYLHGFLSGGRMGDGAKLKLSTSLPFNPKQVTVAQNKERSLTVAVLSEGGEVFFSSEVQE